LRAPDIRIAVADADDPEEKPGAKPTKIGEERMSVASTVVVGAQASAATRWTQLLSVIICMIMIANLQYGWTLFVNPLKDAHSAWGFDFLWWHFDTIAAIQLAFSIFIALETWLTPIEGWIVDVLGPQRGPRTMVAFGGIMVAIGWVINSVADTLTMLYLGAVIGGIGGGAVYATSVGHAVKWFPDRRGLAVGLTAAGYGAGAAMTVIPIRYVIDNDGYQAAFLWFGLFQGAVVFILAWLLRAPAHGEIPATAAPKVQQSKRSYAPAEVLKTPVFWLLYLMFVMVSASGLMATAQVAPIAKDFNVANTVLLFGATTITLALIVDNVANGSARPLFGWISDNIGREYTMVIAFALGGISYWLLGSLGTAPWAFVVFAALIFLTWGEIFSLFPSTCTDTFGPKFATVNLSMLYTAKGASAFFAPVANLIKDATGGWQMVFLVATIMNFAVVALALFVLRPMRARMMEKS
jgi:MFS transporter, OFA family, oxalate/formate antiporter